MTSEKIEVPAPGFFIREELEARGWSQRDLAFVLGNSEQAINLLVSGKRTITPEMAKQLGEAFDVSAEFFLNLQKRYDLSRANDPDPAISRKAKLQTAYPIREMIKRGWLAAGDADLLEAQFARFFEVKDSSETPRMAHAAKKSKEHEATTPTQLAWLYRVRQLARGMEIGKYSEEGLRASLDELRTHLMAPDWIARVPAVLRRTGVRFVIVEPLPNGKIDGACTWLGSDSPVIGMSLRYDRIDNFWFVLRHEIEHVLRKHGREKAMVDTDLDGDSSTDFEQSEEEREANSAAREFCVPSRELESFIIRKSPYISERDLVGFANRLQCHPGIVAGQLRRRLRRWDLFTRHLVKVRHAVLPDAMVDGWGKAPVVSM